MDDMWRCLECEWWNPYTGLCDWGEWKHEDGDAPKLCEGVEEK